MKEAFLHYVWRYQKFLTDNLKTTSGHEVKVLKTGLHNTNAGPDFSEALLIIEGINWSGAVEIHVLSSDWKLHGHQNDPSYQNVILHVVWEDDDPVCYDDGRKIPTLILKNKVDPTLLFHYERLMGAKSQIACSASWEQSNSLTIAEMLENCLVERLYFKSKKAETYFDHVAGDWEATTYFMLMLSMGFKINQHAFERLAYLLPLELIRKYMGQKNVIYALIFGFAGFLEEDFHQKMEVKFQLKKDWEYLKHKHQIQHTVAKQEWKYLRLRPANFPTVRLAQLASILSEFPHLFQSFILEANITDLTNKLKSDVLNIWGMKDFQQQQKANLGKQSIYHIILNTVPPLLALYGRKTDNSTYLNKALDLLEKLKPEKNRVTKIYEDLGVNIKSAYDSQAFLQLYSSYCQPKQCLNCKIGLAIMKNAS